MQSKLLIALIAVACLGVFGWLTLFKSTNVAVASWTENDVRAVPADEVADQLASEAGQTSGNRSKIETDQATEDESEADRPLLTIRGRVVQSTGKPVAEAKVQLVLQSRNWRNRISKEVVTKNDGTFAFSGKGFTRLWVSLSVAHSELAPASAFKNFDDARGDLDMGDIKMVVGGSIVGSITDMQGNVVPGAEARLASDGRRGRFRFMGGNGEQDPVVLADASGTFRIAHIAPGRYRVTASAPHRQRASEGPITVVDGQEERLDPIQLGPGFELRGTVYKPDDSVVAGADVSVRSRDRRGREDRTKTDEHGVFAVDHLPPGAYTVEVRAKGFLPQSKTGIEVTQAEPLVFRLEPGLYLTGKVTDAVTHEPVPKYGIRIHRVAALPNPEADKQREAAQKLFERMRELRGKESTPETEAAMQGLRKELEAMRSTGVDLRGGRRGGDQTGRGGDRGGRGGDRGGRGRGRGGFAGADRGPGSPGGPGGARFGGRGNGGPGGWNWGFGGNRPGDTGPMEAHANGEFRFDGLDEGVYVLDVGTPDHQKLRSERIELRKGAESPALNLVVERGLSVSGTVHAKSGNQEVPRASIELRVVEEERQPDPNNDRPRSPEADAMRNRMREMMRRASGNGPRTTPLLTVRARADGSFQVRNAPPGKYLIRATAEGFTSTDSAVFTLDKDLTGLELTLGVLGTITGRVSGIPPGQRSEARVMAFAFPRNMKSVDVAEDGTYTISGLQPGDYIVRAFLGDARRFIFRELWGNMGRNGGTGTEPTFDVQVREGDTKTFHVAILANPSGTVAGSVLLNGKAARGYRVSLRKVETTPQTENNGMPRFGRFGFGDRSESVDLKGNFEIRDVDAGEYTLSVTRGGGGGGGGRGGRGGRGGFGGGGGGDLVRTRVTVIAGTTTQVPPIVVSSGSLQGTVALPEGTDAASLRGGRATLYKDVTAVPDPNQEGGRDVLRYSARVRDQKVEFQDLPIGNYLLVLRLSGREQTTQQLYVGAGTNPPVTLQPGAVRKPEPNKPNTSNGPASPTGPRARGGRNRGQNGGPGNNGR
ncbi:MAG: carboxypeptidase regulatory-like domain-containing protein [Planctomycetes bacterium]|nr:carboxypeptidase regulatory-like domain-containing protein [Planctomycetota bacterium]MCB9870409.1 carboxypeptidase regulatory-like domain-containing protein [Planctomycetota bacterium]